MWWWVSVKFCLLPASIESRLRLLYAERKFVGAWSRDRDVGVGPAVGRRQRFVEDRFALPVHLPVPPDRARRRLVQAGLSMPTVPGPKAYLGYRPSRPA